jgi:hypothetical protein
MKAVFTLWKQPMDMGLMHCGYLSNFDMAVSTCLAVETARLYYKEIELVTDDSGKELLCDHLKLPFTSVNLALNNYKHIPVQHWAYPKMVAYSVQDRPFIHLDNDVYLWDGIPSDIKSKALAFQNIEVSDTMYNHYRQGIGRFYASNEHSTRVAHNYVPYAFNCGVVMANDIEFVQEWWEAAELYVEHPRNAWMWENHEILTSANHNLVFEQWFPSCLAKQRGLELDRDIGFVLLPYERKGFRFTHTLGHVKREKIVAERVWERVKHQYPNYVRALEDLQPHFAPTDKQHLLMLQ